MHSQNTHMYHRGMDSFQWLAVSRLWPNRVHLNQCKHFLCRHNNQEREDLLLKPSEVIGVRLHSCLWLVGHERTLGEQKRGQAGFQSLFHTLPERLNNDLDRIIHMTN